MKPFLLTFFSFVPFFSPIHGQEVFEWFEGPCLSRAQIDSSKATYLQVQNAHYTLVQASELSQPFLAYQPKDTAYLKLNSIRFECGNFIKELEGMEYPKGAYWANLKKLRLENIREQCLLREKAVIALNQPKILKGSPYCKECSNYVNALVKSGNNILNLWKEIHEKEITGALDPGLIRKAFEQHWNSPEKELWARIEVLRYGWWNCILENQKVWFDEDQYRIEFKKLMTSVQLECH